jgi:hypothetical protein
MKEYATYELSGCNNLRKQVDEGRYNGVDTV